MLPLCLGCSGVVAANIAPLGNGILGYKAEVDSGPGTMLFHAGSSSAIVDGNIDTRVDNWSAGADGGQGISFVGVVWPSLRFEQINSVVLTLNTYGDGGWFGPNGVQPEAGGVLGPEHLQEPIVQISTNGGVSWMNVPFTSDYVASLTGMNFGGVQLTATFTIEPPVSGINGLRLIGPNAGNAGPDPNGFIGIADLTVESTFTDNDGDQMPDRWETEYGLNPATNDAAADADSDGSNNLEEYQTNTLPNNPDTDSDGYSDGAEADDGSNPRDPESIPGNLARLGTAILGTQSALGEETPIFNAGQGTSINDGDPNSRVDTFNGIGTDPTSFVGVVWTEAPTNPVLRLKLTLATFLDGGWFGPNARSPGEGQPLAAAHLTEPAVQVTFDGGFSWTNTPSVSDYLTVMNGHGIGGGTNPNPTFATVTFVLDPPPTNAFGVRLIGPEGGVASGGFIGVTELEIYAQLDSEPDGMDDEWERQHGLVAGANDASGDPDGDSLTNLQEFTNGTDPREADTDDDALPDGLEINTHHTNPLAADTDVDGLKDGEEVSTFGTDPLKMDTDSDLFPDGLEVSRNSSPTDPGRIPANLALRLDATPILGTTDFPGGTDTPVFNAGGGANINDGNPATRVDTFNGAGVDTLSFVGIVWTNAVTNALVELKLDQATFFDGGWFGVNNTGPGASGMLSSNLDLALPTVQVSTDGGLTWTDEPFTSDYLEALEGHVLPPGPGAPTMATAHFTLQSPRVGINGVRIIGTEGGTASGGFVGVFELETLADVPAVAERARLLNARIEGGQFRSELDTQSGMNYRIEFKEALGDAAWQTLTTIAGDGTRKGFNDAAGIGQRFYRVATQ